MNTALFTIVFFVLVTPFDALASSGNGIEKLEWMPRSEVLEYHSCGCGDKCWVAEVKSKRTKKIKASLRCDCEKAYFSVGTIKPEQVYAKNCTPFDGVDKFDAITSALKKNLGR